jgi:hypothetical protein
MKMSEALNVIKNKSGFMVQFEWCGDGFLRGDYFPDYHAGEKLIETEAEAWELAEKFANATKGKTCNIYVLKENFSPVEDYKEREIINR